MTLEEARVALKQLQEKMSAYGHALSLLYYDGVTAAPRGTADHPEVAILIFLEFLEMVSPTL